MPPKSRAQARLMRAVCAGRVRRKPKGLSRAEACEYVKGHPTKRLPEHK